MNKLMILVIALSACGYSSSGNESVGQVKKVLKKTPIICPDYYEIDISLGVMRNGIGSVSHDDMLIAVDPGEKDNISMLKKAAESGAIVKFGYDVKRVSPCWEDHRLTAIVVEAEPPVTPSAPVKAETPTDAGIVLDAAQD